MAVEAPAHRQRRHLLDDLHAVDAAVATHTTHTRLHVPGVVEIHEIGKVMDAHPVDGHARLGALADQGQLLAGRPHRLVAVHAGRRRRHVGPRAGLDRHVAVAAVDAQLARVQRMAVRHRLHRRVADRRVLRGEHAGHQHDQVNHAAQRGNTHRFAQPIGPLGKDEPVVFFGARTAGTR